MNINQIATNNQRKTVKVMDDKNKVLAGQNSLD